MYVPGETITVGALAVRFLVDSPDSGGSLTVFECAVPAAARMPLPHSHDAFEETIYALEGVCTFTVDGVEHELSPGDSLCIRRGQVHGFENRGEDAVTFLAIATPGVFGPDYFLDLQRTITSAAGGPPDPAAIAAVMGRHGLTPVQPAPAGA